MDWKKNRTTLAGGVLAILVGVAAFAVANRNKHDAQGLESEVAATFPTIEKEDIVAVSLEHPEHGKVELRNIDGTWRVSKPVDWPADQNNVEHLLGKVAEIEMVAIAATKKDSHEKLKVDKDGGILVTVETADGKSSFYLGDQNSGETFVRLSGQEPTIATKGMIRWAFDRKISEWRNRKLGELSISDVEKIRIIAGDSRFVFERKGADWVIADGQDKIENFDSEKVARWLSSFASLRAEDFADDLDRKAAGLEEGADVVELELKSNTEQTKRIHRYSFRKRDGKNFLSVDDDPHVYIVGTEIASKFTPKEEDFATTEEQRAAEEARRKEALNSRMQGLDQLPPEVRKQIEAQIANQ